MSGALVENPAMAESSEGRGELNEVLELIRRAGGGVVFEEFPGALDEDLLLPDEVDAGPEPEARQARSAAQRTLIDEANRLAHSRDRVRALGLPRTSPRS